jgi:ABC-type polysaccharide/polyol phosphate export permease
MATERDPEPQEIEVYKQLHETCRHHYRLEWQLFQVGVLAAIALLAFGLENQGNDLKRLSFIVSGLVLVGFSYAMHRQALGFLQANKHLLCYAKIMGDPNVQDPRHRFTSAAVLSRVILLVGGIMLFWYGILGSIKIHDYIQCLAIGTGGIIIPGYVAYTMITARKKIDKD